MIQFNLLPDVKLEYIKARRSKRLVILSSITVTGIAIAILVVLFLAVSIVQRDHLDNLKRDIQADSKKLQDTPDLNKILTIQNQLNSLDQLHDQKAAVERLGKYLGQITPAAVSFSTLDIDFGLNTISFEGSSTSIKAVNEFIDTMKFTTFDLDGESKNAFSSVVLASVDRADEEGESRPVTYQVTLSFDPGIFNITKTVELDVPRKITTRSVTEKPGPLFEPAPEPSPTDQPAMEPQHEEGR